MSQMKRLFKHTEINVWVITILWNVSEIITIGI